MPMPKVTTVLGSIPASSDTMQFEADEAVLNKVNTKNKKFPVFNILYRPYKSKSNWVRRTKPMFFFTAILFFV
jgi:hypothetical protein